MPMNFDHSQQLDLTQVWGPMHNGGELDPLSSATLHQDVEWSSIDVLRAHGIDARRDVHIGGLTMASVIGFSGSGLAGALGLATSDEVLAGMYRLGRSNAGDERQHSDWLRELSNQVLGRFKGRMLARGLTLHIALPQSVRGMHLVPNEHRHNRITWTVLAMAPGPLLVWLDLERIEGQELQVGPPIQACPSGDLILF